MITYFDPCLMKVNAMIFYSKNIDLAEENVMKQADSLFVQQYSYVSDVHAHVPQAQIQMDSFSPHTVLTYKLTLITDKHIKP